MNLRTIIALSLLVSIQSQHVHAAAPDPDSAPASNNTTAVLTVVPTVDDTLPKTYQHVAKNVVAQVLPVAATKLSKHGWESWATFVNWNSADSYKNGDQVIFLDHYYVATKDSTNEHPWEKSDSWQEFKPSTEQKLWEAYTKGDDQPVFLDSSAAAQDYTDWNSINASVEFAPGQATAARSYIDVNIKALRQRYYAYRQNASDSSYDLSTPPSKLILTRAEEAKNWNQLSYGKGFFNNPKAWGVIIGFSPPNFKIGSTSSEPVDANTTYYLVGVAYQLNPYSGLNVGMSTGDGHSFSPTFGFHFDVSIIGKLFGGH